MAFEWRFAHIDGHCGNHSLSVVKDILCDIKYFFKIWLAICRERSFFD